MLTQYLGTKAYTGDSGTITRVCLLTFDFPPFRSSGLTVYAEKIAFGLAARHHIVTVVLASRPQCDRVEAVVLPDSDCLSCGQVG